MEKKQNVPALRFQGFSDEWISESFENLSSRVSTMDNSSALPRVEYEDIVSGAGVLNKDIYKKSSSKTGIKFSTGDILYGKLRPYLKNWLFATFPGIAVGDFWVLHPEKVAGNFLYCLIQSNSYQNLVNMTTGTKMPRADWAVISKAKFVVPYDLDEQERIGKFLTDFDKNIFVCREKIQKLRQFRQAMLTKLFPREGAAEPELRFRGFSGKWKSCCLTDIATINPPGELPETFNYVDLESVIGTEIVKYRRETKFSAPSRAQRVAEDNDVFYQMVRPYQKNNCIFRGNDKTFVFSTGYAQLRPNCNSYFLLSLLQTEYFVGKVMELCTGTSFPAISASDLARIPIYVPVMSEENGAIGEYFQNLDSYISLQQKKLERMQRLKAALLEKLFV